MFFTIVKIKQERKGSFLHRIQYNSLERTFILFNFVENQLWVGPVMIWELTGELIYYCLEPRTRVDFLCDPWRIYFCN